MKDRVALVLSALTFALHLAVANRYDVFRDELYFIVCGRHPALGYADQPPLVPLLAAGFYGLGAQTWLLRLPAVIAAAVLVWLVIRFTRLIGGGDAAGWAAGIAAATAPVLMGLTATLNTTTFEPLAWAFVAYALARALLRDDDRVLWWCGLVAGLAMEAKYALPLWLGTLAVGLIATPQRRLFKRPALWGAVALAAAVGLPSLFWQAAHGWPFITLLHNAGVKDVAVTPLAFYANQVFVLNPWFAPLWLAGLVAPFVVRALAPLRFIAIAYVVAAFAIVAGHGKDYYLAPAYAPLFAIGAVAFEQIVRSASVRTAYLALAVAFSAVAAPLALPLLSPPALISYERTLHIAPQQQERGDTATPLPSTFADMLGWHDFVRQVAAAYDRVPPAQRARTSILVDNYGEAAALDVYGAPYGLPPALSGHNQYGFWGLRGQDPQNVVRIQRHVEKLRPYCRTTATVARTFSPYARGFENGQAIALCFGLHPPLGKLFPALKQMI
ncbi:MAG: glycosyltransferase family 39 protein [Candidatus Eremiobacteraeota bacterium]|nr:glycosyltransferase family 39 protein [Candidatus Eremiobacteraeota bacterium]MBC5802684.1 glycosyltransferase family 39 protein [Candidatus Eremiobacteraeota bacterium]MBC5820872.1 glycosyltransferase family 39 protein [Candidatus Eremiobacteraeota bacterium]